MQRLTHWLPWILVILLAVIIGWQWWVRGGTNVTVTGEATVKAAPDEYVFHPAYDAKATTEQAARDAATETGNTVVSELRKLGVTDAMLTNRISVYENGKVYYLPDQTDATNPDERYVATYTLTVTVHDLELAKKILAYLATTPLNGQLTPMSTFSDDTRKELERQARRKALEDARLQAEDTAEVQDAKIRSVVSIGEPRWGGAIPLSAESRDAVASSPAPGTGTTPELLTGEQEVSYAIEVVYRIR